MVIATTSRLRWGPVTLLPFLAVAAWAVIADWPPAVAIRGGRRNIPANDRWREPTEDDEYAARSELRGALTAWQTKSPRPPSSALTPPMVRIVKQWPRTDAGYRALLILCPLGGDPIETAWHAVNRPFRRDVPESVEKAFLELKGPGR